jgi:hypothetical protein
MRVMLLATMAQLPRLPLASSETETPICTQINLNSGRTGVSFQLSETFGKQMAAVSSQEKLVIADRDANGPECRNSESSQPETKN